MRVFVTGASGVVGGAVLRRLVAEGNEIRALSRTARTDVILEASGAEPVRGDVLDPASLAPAVAGAEVVFHIAGVNEMCGRHPEHMVRVNVGGSVNVVDAARRAGCRRVVYTSSAAALGERVGTVGSETSPHRGWYLSEYERSKHLAERAVMALEGIEIVTVNPSSVQGPGRATGTGKIVLDIARGKLPFVVDTTISIVDIDDCAEGHVAAATRGNPGERYVLNSFTITLREALAMLERHLGRSLRVRYLPRSAMSLAGVVGELHGRVTRRPAPICLEMARTVLHGHRYDGSLAAQALSIAYTTPEGVLERLVAWYRTEGMLE